LIKFSNVVPLYVLGHFYITVSYTLYQQKQIHLSEFWNCNQFSDFWASLLLAYSFITNQFLNCHCYWIYRMVHKKIILF